MNGLTPSSVPVPLYGSTSELARLSGRTLPYLQRRIARGEDKQKAFAAVADLVGSKIAPKLTQVLNQLATDGLAGVTEAAKDAGQVIESETIKRMDDLGDRTTALQTRLQTWGSKVLSFVFDIGEGLGVLAAKTLNTIQGVQTDYSGMETVANHVNVALEKGTVLLKGTAATAEDLKRLQDARSKLTEKELSDNEKLNMWIGQYAEKINEASRYKKDSKEYDAAMVDATNILIKMKDQELTQEKKLNEERQKAAEQEQKVRDSRAWRAHHARALSRQYASREGGSEARRVRRTG